MEVIPDPTHSPVQQGSLQGSTQAIGKPLQGKEQESWSHKHSSSGRLGGSDHKQEMGSGNQKKKKPRNGGVGSSEKVIESCGSLRNILVFLLRTQQDFILFYIRRGHMVSLSRNVAKGVTCITSLRATCWPRLHP